MKRLRRSPLTPWNTWETVGLTILILVVFFSISTAIALLFVLAQIAQNPALETDTVVQAIQRDGLVLSIATLVAGTSASGLIIVLLKLRPAFTIQQYLALRSPRGTAWFLWNGLLLVLIIFSASLLRAIQHQETFTAEIYRTTPSPLLLYIAIVGIAPLFEELLFRGFLFQGLQSSPLGARGAIVLTAGGWAILHAQYDPVVIGQILIFGLLFGMARWQTQSLLIPLSMHSLNNFLSLLATGLNMP